MGGRSLHTQFVQQRSNQNSAAGIYKNTKNYDSDANFKYNAAQTGTFGKITPGIDEKQYLMSSNYQKTGQYSQHTMNSASQFHKQNNNVIQDTENNQFSNSEEVTESEFKPATVNTDLHQYTNEE